MKILWISDSPTYPTGFGNVTGAVCAGLADYGHQVSILGWQTYSQERWHNCTLYPFPLERNPTVDALLRYMRQLRPDVVVLLGEVWWFPSFHHPLIADFVRTAGIAWVLYYPLGGDLGGGRLPQDWIDILGTVELPIATSRYGVQVSLANGVRPAYIPAGVDTNVFQPPQSKEQAKQAFGYEGQFVLFSDARNHPRKQLPRTLEIFRRFAADKDDVLLHLHCDPGDPESHTLEYCYNLRAEIAALDLTSKVHITAGMSMSRGLPITALAKLYQAADVHLLASAGERFGLSTLQAAAAGVVPLAVDYSATRELVGNHGEAIRVQHFWPGPFDMRRAFIDMDDAVSKLEQLYWDRERLAAKAERARRFALGYDWERILREWHELLSGEVLPRIRYPWLRPGQPADKKVQTRKQVREWVTTMFTSIPRAAVRSVLDCGGTRGYTVKFLREQGLQACGFDLSNWAVREGQWEFPELAKVDEDLDVPVLRRDDVTKLEGYADNSFDLVLAIDVLAYLPPEHLEQALATLVRVSRQYVYLAVPIREQDADAEGDQAHLNAESRTSWEQLFAQYGVECLTREHVKVRLPSAPNQVWNVFPLHVKKTGKNGAVSSTQPPALALRGRP